MEDLRALDRYGEERSYMFTVYSESRDLARYPDPQEYAIKFDRPFKNVVGFEVIEALLPRSQYLIDEHNRTLVLFVGDVRHRIDVPVGEYTFDTLLEALNSRLLPIRVRASLQDRGRNVIEFTSDRFLRLDVLDSPLARFLGFEMSNAYLDRPSDPAPQFPSDDSAIVSYAWVEPPEGTSALSEFDPHHAIVASVRTRKSANTTDRFRFPQFVPLFRTPAVDAFVGPNALRVRAKVRYDSSQTFPDDTVFETIGYRATSGAMRQVADAWTFWNTFESQTQGPSETSRFGAFEASTGLDTTELFDPNGGLRLGYATVPGALTTQSALTHWTSGLAMDNAVMIQFRFRPEDGEATLFRYGTDESHLALDVSSGVMRYRRAETAWTTREVRAGLRRVVGVADSGIVDFVNLGASSEEQIFEIVAENPELGWATDDETTVKDDDGNEWNARIVQVGDAVRLQVHQGDEDPDFVDAVFPLSADNVQLAPPPSYAPYEWRSSFRRGDVDAPFGTVGMARVGDVWTPAVVVGIQDGGEHVHLAVQNAAWNPVPIGPPVAFRVGGRTTTLTGPTVTESASQRGEIQDVYVGAQTDLSSVETPTPIQNDAGRQGILMRIAMLPGGTWRLEVAWEPDPTPDAYATVSFAGFEDVTPASDPGPTTLFAQPVGVDVSGPAYVRSTEVPSSLQGDDAVRLTSDTAVLAATVEGRDESVGSDPDTGESIDRILWRGRVFERDPLLENFDENRWAGPGATAVFTVTTRTIRTRTSVVALNLIPGASYWGRMRVMTDRTVSAVLMDETTIDPSASALIFEDRNDVRGTPRPDGRRDGEVVGLEQAKLSIPYSSRLYQTVGSDTPTLLGLWTHVESQNFTTQMHPTLVNDALEQWTVRVEAPETYRWRGLVLFGQDLAHADAAGAMVVAGVASTVVDHAPGRIEVRFDAPVEETELDVTIDRSALGDPLRFHHVVGFGHPVDEWDGYIERTFTGLDPQIPHAVGFDPTGRAFVRNGGTNETHVEDLGWSTFLDAPTHLTVASNQGGYDVSVTNLLFADPAYVFSELDALYRFRETSLVLYSTPDDPRGVVKRFDLFPRESAWVVRSVTEISQRFTIEGVDDPGYLSKLTLFLSDTSFLDEKYPLRVRLLDYKGELVDEFVELFVDDASDSRIEYDTCADSPCVDFPDNVPDLTSLTIDYSRFTTPSEVRLVSGLPYTVTLAFSFPDMPDVAFRLPVFDSVDGFRGTARVLEDDGGPRDVPGFVPLHVVTENITNRITSPGITMLTPGSFVKLSVPELEDYMFTKQNYDARTTGVASFFLAEELAHQYFRFDYGALQYQPSQPIARISGLTFRFLRDDDTLYNFRGVNHVLKVVVKFLAPTTDHDFPSELAPQYDGTRVVYADGREDEDDETVIRPYVPDP